MDSILRNLERRQILDPEDLSANYEYNSVHSRIFNSHHPAWNIGGPYYLNASQFKSNSLIIPACSWSRYRIQLNYGAHASSSSSFSRSRKYGRSSSRSWSWSNSRAGPPRPGGSRSRDREDFRLNFN